MTAGTITLAGPGDVTDLGRALAVLLRAGDLVILTGDLGAGKTTLTQGIGAGLNVRGPITSPTFVIARLHPSLSNGPSLVHVDAYRLGSTVELDDLDLDADIADCVTVVEWGEGLAEDLADSHLAVHLIADADTDLRTLRLSSVGERWSSTAMRSALTALVSRPTDDAKEY